MNLELDINVLMNLIQMIMIVYVLLIAKRRNKTENPIVGYVVVHGKYIHHDNTLEGLAKGGPGQWEIVTQPPMFLQNDQRVYALDTFGKIILIHLPHRDKVMAESDNIKRAA